MIRLSEILLSESDTRKPLQVGDSMLVKGEPAPITSIDPVSKIVGVDYDGGHYRVKLTKPPMGNWRIPDGYRLPWDSGSGGAQSEQDEAKAIADFFLDQAHAAGCSLKELGWGLDTPAQIRAVNAGKRGAATAAQLKLLCQALVAYCDYQGESIVTLAGDEAWAACKRLGFEDRHAE